MIPVNRTYAPIQALVDELARCGLEHAVTCPGSRNAPVALTLADEPRLRAWSVLDERSAGFFALGLAKATGRPVAVTTTSGSATANLLPAVVEARESRVPLIVLSADRPPELRDVGAGQAIDQLGIFGSAAKWFVEVGNHEPGPETGVHFRALACRAFATAAGGRPGVVHLNLALREPLAPAPEPLDPAPWAGRPGGRPWTSVEQEPARPAPIRARAWAEEIAARPRGALVCGPSAEPTLPAAAAALARAAGWPLLAEPSSGARCGPHDRSHVISHYDGLLRSEAFRSAHRAELVVRIGDTPTSKALRGWLSEAERQLLVDPHLAWHEPTRRAERIAAVGGADFCRAVAAELDGRTDPDPGWLDDWRAADALVPAALEEAPDPFEPRALAALAHSLSEPSTIWVASSMPVRDVETFFPSVPTPIRFLANRGANGIDGTVSSALGAAAADPARRTYLLTGELSLLHDLGGLLIGARHGLALTIVCLNNGGGGIFDFLPVAGHADPPTYEEHVATPAGIELERVAALVGLPHVVASTPDEVRTAAARPGLVEVRTDRALNVERHREVFAQVARGLEAAAPS
jgi:2-succinyl-5-enolpyruvyl-6-hydroxy-3-cyclohexene-1-carboxylate synthase